MTKYYRYFMIKVNVSSFIWIRRGLTRAAARRYDGRASGAFFAQVKR